MVALVLADRALPEDTVMNELVRVDPMWKHIAKDLDKDLTEMRRLMFILGLKRNSPWFCAMARLTAAQFELNEIMKLKD